MSKKQVFAAIVTYWLATLGTAYAHENHEETIYIPAYSYHLKPPFIIDQPAEAGLYYDLVDALSDHKYHYYLVYIPRKRIDRLLSTGTLDGIVVGVSPHWFKDRDETKYAWTASFMSDRDDIISPQTAPYEHSRANLVKKSMAGVRGFFYAGIDPIAEELKVRRFDTESELKVLEMVLRGRADFGIISQSTLGFIAKTNDDANGLYISSTPHEAFERRILVPRQNQAVYQHVKAQTQALAGSETWQQVLRGYGMKPKPALLPAD